MTSHQPAPSPGGLPRLSARKPESHKGDYGRVLVLGGSRGMFGAAALAGLAALRAGCGLATVATRSDCLGVVAQFSPCYTTLPLPVETDDLAAGAATVALRHPADVLACGPGLGQSAGVCRLVETVYNEAPRPLVVDADGLNALALGNVPLDAHRGPRVLTPHPGEFRRLLAARGLAMPEARDAQCRLAHQWAAEASVVIVLKGHRTLVTDGSTSYQNTTGNPGMATGGSGDVLTGVIAALIGQGLSPWDAAVLGVYVHGLAGDLAAARHGQIGLIASDLLDSLPEAMRSVADSPPPETSVSAHPTRTSNEGTTPP